MERIRTEEFFKAVQPTYELISNRKSAKTLALGALKDVFEGTSYIGAIACCIWYLANFDKVIEFSNSLHYLSIDANNWFYSILQTFQTFI